MPGGEIPIQTAEHPNPRGRWITFRLLIRGSYPIFVVLDTGSPASAISPGIERELLGRNLLEQGEAPYRYRLSGLTVEDQPLPDLQVMVLPRLARIEVDGLVGLNYLTQFSYVHFDTPTFRLALGPPLVGFANPA